MNSLNATLMHELGRSLRQRHELLVAKLRLRLHPGDDHAEAQARHLQDA